MYETNSGGSINFERGREATYQSRCTLLQVNIMDYMRFIREEAIYWKKCGANRGKRLPPFRIRHWWQLTETAVFQCRLKSSFLNLAFVIFTLISVDTEHFVYPCCYYACRRRSRKKTSAICLRISRWNSWRWKSTSWNPVTRRNSLQGRSLIWAKIIFIIIVVIIIIL